MQLMGYNFNSESVWRKRIEKERVRSDKAIVKSKFPSAFQRIAIT